MRTLQEILGVTYTPVADWHATKRVYILWKGDGSPSTFWVGQFPGSVPRFQVGSFGRWEEKTLADGRTVEVLVPDGPEPVESQGVYLGTLGQLGTALLAHWLDPAENESPLDRYPGLPELVQKQITGLAFHNARLLKRAEEMP